MRSELAALHRDLSRREVLALTGRTTLAAALGGAALGTAPSHAHAHAHQGPGGDAFDAPVDVALAEAGGWAPSRYGARDERGSLNEVTPRKTARALRLLDKGTRVKTYDLSELLRNGFPAFPTNPPRIYEQRLVLNGYSPPPGFEGIVQGTTPIASNRLSLNEERFPFGGTYQIGTQLDNLNHVGVGDVFYNGFRGPEIARTYGTEKLGAEKIGPVVTRGLLLDVLGVKLVGRETAALAEAANGEPVLRDDYRITVEDLEAAMSFGRIRQIEPGDAVLIRTGWNQVGYTDPARFLASEPGIYLREARWLASSRPALVGSDTWGGELLGNPVVEGFAQVHQELLTHHGIRILESAVLDELAQDRVSRFVFLLTPPNPLGATATNAGPAALAPLP